MHHENIQELVSLRPLNLNLECQNECQNKWEEENIRGNVLNHHHAIGYYSCFYSSILLLKSSYCNSYAWSKKITMRVK